jgi:hypothetical protein
VIVRRRLAVIVCLTVAAIAVTTHALAQNYVRALTPVVMRATPITSFDITEPTRTRFGAL